MAALQQLACRALDLAAIDVLAREGHIHLWEGPSRAVSGMYSMYDIYNIYDIYDIYDIYGGDKGRGSSGSSGSSSSSSCALSPQRPSPPQAQARSFSQLALGSGTHA